MKVDNETAVPVYTVSGPSFQPLTESLAKQDRRSLKKSRESANRLDLLQWFEFSGASNCIRVSEDGNWAMSTGTYPPQMHIHDLHKLTLSYSRHTVSQNVKFTLLSQDYTKSVHLQEDRRIEFHTPMGLHYHVRIPRYGRDIVYDHQSAEVWVPAAGLNADGFGEVFRMNLEVGRFQKSFQIELNADEGVERGLQGSIGAGSVNTAAIAERTHGLAAFGTSMGTVECWDPRYRARVATLETHDGEITALNFSRDGMSLTTGSSRGVVKLYDLRNPKPLLTNDTGLGDQIKSLIELTPTFSGKKILVADKRSVRIFDKTSGELWTTINPGADINCVAHCPDSGMLLSANEGTQQHAWFIPMLGPAPEWCKFLERFVGESAEDDSTSTYDNYKFLTRPELRSLNLDHLVGRTGLLRPYMHGFFVASKLYDQARLIANPYEHEEARARIIKEKIKKQSESRIRGTKKVKVNQKLVDTLLEKQANRGKVDTNAGILGDARFGQMFESAEFTHDENNEEFLAQNSGRTKTILQETTGTASSKPKQDSGSSSDGSDSSDNDDDNDDSDDSDDGIRRRKPSRDNVVMRQSSSAQRGVSRNATIGSRATAAEARAKKNGRFGVARTSTETGGKEVTFIPLTGKNGRRREQTEEPTIPARKVDKNARRSASNNTFRNLRK